MITFIKTATYNNSLAVLSSGLTRQYQEIAMYMAANKLVINVKTHLLVLGTKSVDQNKELLTMQAGNHTFTPS